MVNINDTIEIYDYDETYIQILAERAILSELYDYFSYDVPNAKFMPAYKNKLWDGKIRLFDLNTQRLYKGLLPYVKKFCTDRQYDYTVDDDLKTDDSITDEYIENYIKSLGIVFEPYDYQLTAIKHCIKNNRSTLLSPTSSGKSLIIYALLRYYLDHTDEKILICVPTVSLIYQLEEEFQQYNPDFNISDYIHKIHDTKDKNDPDKRVYISTWQSVYKQSRKYFSQFSTVIVDEAHQAKADSLKGILTKAAYTKYRFGLTGTLDNLQYNRLIIEGLTGVVYTTIKTKDLIKNSITSNLKINCLVLKYPDNIRQANKNFKYHDEMKFITECNIRNKVITKLIKTIDDKNGLVLTQYKKHIENIAKAIREKTNKSVYVVTGDTDVIEREKVRKLAENNTNVVIVATYGVYSTGINIKNLQYIIKATGSKSQIRILQSIGRGLRRDNKENKIIVFDLVDDFSHKKKRNYILKHFFERIAIYENEEFDYSITNINI